MYSARVKSGTYLLEGLNAFATTLYFNYLFYHMREQFGFTNLGNLTLAAVNGAVYAGVVWMAGRFAQRRGYFTALKVGFAVMAVAMVFAGLARSVPGCYAAMIVWAFGIAFTWPALEGIVCEGEPRHRLPRLLGIYNVIWAGGSGAATFIGGAMMQSLGPRSTFVVPALLHVAQLVLALRLERAAHPAGSLPAAAIVPIREADLIERIRSPVAPATFMKMAWVANPFAYVAISGLIPVIPQRAADLHLSLAAAGIFTSVWMLARAATFAALWFWPGWHYRFRWLIGSYLALAGCFVLVLVSQQLWLLVVAQLGFGFGVGLVYYSSLYYSMDVGETKGEHGGFHEAALGLGICAGPAVGALSLRFFPHAANMNTWTIASLLAVGLAALYALRYRRPGN